MVGRRYRGGREDGWMMERGGEGENEGRRYG